MSIARNTAYNLVGTLVPIVLALATVPAYLALIGAERYGILAIAWLILGYFGLFDLGLGRATSQRIAALRDAPADERAMAFGTALGTNIGIGFIGAMILAPIAWWMFAHGMAADPALRAEALRAVPLLALAVPVATTLGVLSGAMMGRERFLDANRISITSTILFQLIPLAVAWGLGPNLTGLLAASIGARLIGLFLLWQACTGEFGSGSVRRFDRSQLRALLAYGGWVTLTAIFGPLLVIVDRFAIGAVLSAVAVTIYTVPMQVTTRLGSLASSLGNALFPRLAMAQGAEATRLSRNGVAVLLACLTPPVVAAFFLMQPALVLWVGHEIGERAAPVGRILLVAAWINTFAQVPYVRLQAQGRPDLVAKTLLAEVPFYLPALYVGLQYYGLTGAAVVYLLRVVVDLLLLAWVAEQRLHHAAAIGGFCLLFVAIELWLRWSLPGMLAAAGLAVGFAFVAIVPCWLLLPAEGRQMIATVIARLHGRMRKGAPA